MIANAERFANHALATAALAVAVVVTSTAVVPVAQAGGGTQPTEAQSPRAVIGAAAPDFTLTDTDGEAHTLSDYTTAGAIVVIEWFNPDCPFIKKHHAAHKTMNDLRTRFSAQNVVWLAINSSAPGKQGYGLERNRKAREDYAMAYPILIDESGAVGRAYGAKTTPHMFVVGKDGTLFYAGAIDNDNDVTELGDVNYVAAALTAITAGKPVAQSETKPYGCSVKYSD
jgi:peroxiredoxin